MMRSFLLASLLTAPFLSAAQVDLGPMPGQRQEGDQPSTERSGDVVVRLTPEISKLLNAYGERKHVQKGYRVQIFLGDRATAEATKRAFLQKNPETPAYLSWLAPNFRLRVGDLRTRLEAERLLRDLKTVYPGSYIVPDEIEMPRID